MIKGVNRQVVEITQTDCDYFERILFIVKPEYSTVSEGKLRERAGMMSSAGKPPAALVRRRTAAKIASLLGAAAAGALICALLHWVV